MYPFSLSSPFNVPQRDQSRGYNRNKGADDSNNVRDHRRVRDETLDHVRRPRDQESANSELQATVSLIVVAFLVFSTLQLDKLRLFARVLFALGIISEEVVDQERDWDEEDTRCDESEAQPGRWPIDLAKGLSADENILAPQQGQ